MPTDTKYVGQKEFKKIEILTLNAYEERFYKFN